MTKTNIISILITFAITSLLAIFIGKKAAKKYADKKAYDELKANINSWKLNSESGIYEGMTANSFIKELDDLHNGRKINKEKQGE